MRDLLESGIRSGLFYRSFFDQLGQAAFLLDRTGMVFTGNPACKSLTGYDPWQWERKPFWSLAIPEEREMVRLQTQFAMEGKPRPFCTYLAHQTDYAVQVRITFDSFQTDGEVVGYFAIVQEIMGTRNDSESCASADLSKEGVFIYRSGSLQYANQVGVKLVGAPHLNRLLQTPFFSLFHPHDIPVVDDMLKRTERGETVHPLEIELVRMDGIMIDAEVLGTYAVISGKPSCYLLIRDITERKRAQEFLQNSEKLALVGQLAAGIAHEIRNPLTSLKGFVQLMQKDGMRKAEYFSIMSSELVRIELIVNELLVLAKPHEAAFETRDLSNLVSHVVALLETEAILRKVMIQVIFETDMPMIRCDENHLKQAFINFLKNGIEAMQGGGEIVVRLRCEDNRAVIRFEDNGVGIPPHQLARLGEAFFTTKESGTGLGLMVSRRIIENHRGTLRLTSVLGQGTTVEVSLPVHG
ncbi:ATP-binding protein [Brevibacillus nitrificans]|uniref:ATP-binding protein n=1 Tax=Brevibacillus nitrificans TaxID=651560 RepID=UPI002860F7C2|nr:ATP-binding protein [Brevibacillus nitrificans]MDR7314800.1 two-component system sporulation sensor kinase A [Brevibacillus nitrificans]